ncbi:hypothetical protein OSB04_018972 [Centaurea solstitialis]|uniref:Uncharacterized protein n=1 Tax=Centaurea solstitialis TaxID=347529 RepID=A0AA38SR12_9ASTR|nr:hypothetical protein OSB04_018972 [Centaurea solstitialis]
MGFINSIMNIHSSSKRNYENDESKSSNITSLQTDIMQQKNDWSYVRLPTGDSGRFEPPDITVFRLDRGFSTSSPTTRKTGNSGGYFRRKNPPEIFPTDFRQMLI